MKVDIGISAANLKKVCDNLNAVLADGNVLYLKLRKFHWNLKGPDFMQFHRLFEEQYEAIEKAIDEVAERILTLGHVPDHSYSEYLRHAKIKEVVNQGNGKDALKSVMDSLSILLDEEREILQLAADANDEGTNALMSDYIRQQEKLVWMFCSYLSH